jgi:D-alanyl-D-alanine carboxypeptidase (penicillin-binding protein 5/6)
VADASGFSPKTVSTAKDLVKLGEAAMQSPVLAEVVNQPSAIFPEVGPVNNVNWLLGTDGIVGIKTGNTDQAGGCYLFAAKHRVDGRQITIIGAIMDAKNRTIAMQDSRGLIDEAADGFTLTTTVRADHIAGRYTLPWGGSVDAMAKAEIRQLVWKGHTVTVDTDIEPVRAPKSVGDEVGSISSVSSPGQSTDVVLKQPIPEPSWTWRIFR